MNVLSNTDDVGLALVPARSMTRGGERPLAVPIAPLDAAQRSSLRAALADPSAEPPTEVGGRPIYDALAAAYTTMTDGYVANRANMIVALVAGPNSDVDAADDDAQLAGLVGELRVGASGANAHPVRVVAIVLAQASIEPSAPVVAALTKVGRASNGNAAVANSAADAAEVVASALAEPPR